MFHNIGRYYRICIPFRKLVECGSWPDNSWWNENFFLLEDSIFLNSTFILGYPGIHKHTYFWTFSKIAVIFDHNIIVYFFSFYLKERKNLNLSFEPPQSEKHVAKLKLCKRKYDMEENFSFSNTCYVSNNDKKGELFFVSNWDVMFSSREVSGGYMDWWRI